MELDEKFGTGFSDGIIRGSGCVRKEIKKTLMYLERCRENHQNPASCGSNLLTILSAQGHQKWYLYGTGAHLRNSVSMSALV